MIESQRTAFALCEKANAGARCALEAETNFDRGAAARGVTPTEDPYDEDEAMCPYVADKIVFGFDVVGRKLVVSSASLDPTASPGHLISWHPQERCLPMCVLSGTFVSDRSIATSRDLDCLWASRPEWAQDLQPAVLDEMKQFAKAVRTFMRERTMNV